MTADDEPGDTMLTTTDVAGRLGYSEEQVRRLCELGRFDGDQRGGIPGAYRAGAGCHWRIPVAAVAHFLEASRLKIVRRGSPAR